jgi:hypothetical protein
LSREIIINGRAERPMGLFVEDATETTGDIEVGRTVAGAAEEVTGDIEADKMIAGVAEEFNMSHCGRSRG